jgi:hypothetical protein
MDLPVPTAADVGVHSSEEAIRVRQHLHGDGTFFRSILMYDLPVMLLFSE